MQKRFGPHAQALLKAYPLGENNIPRSARNLMRDAAFGWQTWSWARLQSNTGNSPVLIAYVDSIEEVHKNSKKLKNIKQLKAVDIYSFASKKNIENGLQEIGGCWKNDIEMKKEEMLDDLKTNKNSKIIINDQN